MESVVCSFGLLRKMSMLRTETLKAAEDEWDKFAAAVQAKPYDERTEEESNGLTVLGKKKWIADKSDMHRDLEYENLLLMFQKIVLYKWHYHCMRSGDSEDIELSKELLMPYSHGAGE